MCKLARGLEQPLNLPIDVDVNARQYFDRLVLEQSRCNAIAGQLEQSPVTFDQQLLDLGLEQVQERLQPVGDKPIPLGSYVKTDNQSSRRRSTCKMVTGNPAINGKEPLWQTFRIESDTQQVNGSGFCRFLAIKLR